ncbi:MAG: HAMP domain-containing protein [Gemmatimonadetes bacterium]|nr:HAMP domain-containing protein [Gemmatimonadota bacterium]
MTPLPKSIDARLHHGFEWLLERLPSRLGSRLKRATGGRLGIGTQIVVGLGGGVLLTIVSILMALVLMSVVSGRQREITRDHIPALVSAFDVAQRSAELVGATPGLLAATGADELERILAELEATKDLLKETVAAVAESQDGDPESSVVVRSEVVPLVDSLVVVVQELGTSVVSRLNHQSRLRELGVALDGVTLNLQQRIEGEVDDQHFFMRVGLRELEDMPVADSRRRTMAELNHYSGLLLFKAYQNEVTAQVAQAMTENDRQQLRVNRERFQTALNDVEEALDEVRPPARDRLRELMEEMESLSVSPRGVFATKDGELEEIAAAAALVVRSNRIAERLVERAEALKEDADSAAFGAAASSQTLVQLGVWFMLVVSVLTIVLGLVAWKVFGERLLVRMRRLSIATRKMSRGDLEVQVEIEGNDELTDMADALEVFRQHALEVQRLNLVEELAKEVQAKNSELEETLDNLQRTQQQVIKQEKLASLGALTAGVAHEIRNPLNFVNNFATLSAELIEELGEEVADLGKEGGEELDPEYVGEILADLRMNLTKVNEHGERANSIVDGMLAHSRDEAGRVESVDVNALVREYARLAYHGMRGTDSSFNCDMIYQIDQDAGKIDAVTSDLSRVFLNVITNACHATQARAAKEDDSYMPAVTITTEGGEDDVTVSVRDNGTGIPDDILGRIFDPFFTTKPGTTGTGLGLSISHEIVQEHGGKFEVDTEPGSFTEFRITIPRKGENAALPGP